MGHLKVEDDERLKVILETFALLDQKRWEHADNYNLINYCSNDLTGDEKLLTHWLSYITDRQMPFMRIWELGGFVISDLVRDYVRNRDKRAIDI